MCILLSRVKKNQGVNNIKSEITSITIYMNEATMFNKFFTKANFNRFNIQTNMYVLDMNTLRNLLQLWANSLSPRDNLYSLPTPLPNVKDFCWDQPQLNDMIRKRYVYYFFNI